MRTGMACGFLAVVLAPGLAGAQTKVSGTVVCGSPDSEQRLSAADAADHVFAISQSKCSWTKPMQIAGSTTKDDSFTNFNEYHGSNSTATGFGVGTLVSGDTFHVRTLGKGVAAADGVHVDGTWKFEGGTGKLKAVKGGGTYRCASKPEGLVCDVAGSYSLPK